MCWDTCGGWRVHPLQTPSLKRQSLTLGCFIILGRHYMPHVGYCSWRYFGSTARTGAFHKDTSQGMGSQGSSVIQHLMGCGNLLHMSVPQVRRVLHRWAIQVIAHCIGIKNRNECLASMQSHECTEEVPLYKPTSTPLIMRKGHVHRHFHCAFLPCRQHGNSAKMGSSCLCLSQLVGSFAQG